MACQALLARTVQADQTFTVQDGIWLKRALNYPGGEEGGKERQDGG